MLELLIVIIIIMVLFSITAVGLSWFREKSQIAATKALIGRIQLGLSRYHEVFLEYPPSGGEWDGSQNLVHYLGEILQVPREFDSTGATRTEDWGPAMGPGGFKDSEKDSSNYVIDIWGNPLQYVKPGIDHGGKDNTSSYDIESYGLNEVPEVDGSSDDDDINNWKIE